MCLRLCAVTTLLLAWSFAALPSSVHAQEKRSHRKKQVENQAVTEERVLRMSDAVACRSIDGYERYEVLPRAELTSEEKLLVYYRPLNFKIASRGDDYIAHFTQDGQIRRKGEKPVLLRKKNLGDYEAKSRTPPENLFIKNSFSLKGLAPGEYEYDIILRDENDPGSTATQSLKFRVIAPVMPKPVKEKKPAS
jgi:hypothetical protein